MSQSRPPSRRVFHAEWTYDYLFIPWEGKALCMVCSKIIAHIKVFNIRRHYNAFHKTTYDEIHGIYRKELVQRLKDELPMLQERKRFSRKVDETAAHQVALKIATSGHSCKDGTFIKDCMVAVAKIVAPDKVQLFQDVDLSEEVLNSKLKDLNESLGSSLSTNSNEFLCFSLAIDHFADLSGTMQFGIFIRGVTRDLTIHEDFLGTVSLEDTASSQGFVESVLRLLRYWCSSLPIHLLVGLTSNKSFIVSEESSSVASLLKTKAMSCISSSGYRLEKGPFVLHCILHQISRCMQMLCANDALEVATKCIELLRNSRSKQPAAVFTLIAQSKIGSFDQSEVGWIENVKILEPFLQLTNHVQEFLKKSDISLTTKDGADVSNLLSDTAWLVDLAFLVDVSRHIKQVFNCLTSNDQHISEVYFALLDFKSKLAMLRAEINEGNLDNFSSVSNVLSANDKAFCPDFIKYGLLCKDFEDSFSNSFKEFNKATDGLRLFCDPFSYSLPEDQNNLDLSHIELDYELKLLQSSSTIPRQFFEELSLKDFYRRLDENCYPILVNNARFWTAQFSTTYMCKRTRGKVEQQRAAVVKSVSSSYSEAEFRLAMKSTES